jgi:NAD(P)-dependent dehydrogenase (short-subunit alcohol dehydrogenase family)
LQLENLFSVKEKVVLVTGGSRGIGEMIASGFVANGAKVYITARKAEVCDETAARLSEHGECISLPCDISEMDGIEQLAAELEKREERLDVLVNNAGAAWGAPLEEFPEAGWDKVMDLNVKSIFFLSRRMLPLLRKAHNQDDPARIINIGSIDGMHVPVIENYSYSAAKAAVHQLTRVMAKKLAPEDILVNAIAPGPFQSHMMRATLEALGDQIKANNPRGRIGTPEDIAGVSIFLASRAGAYTTGTVIPCDGGIITTI